MFQDSCHCDHDLTSSQNRHKHNTKNVKERKMKYNQDCIV